MWHKVSGTILRNRILILSLVVLYTLFMGYKATQVEMSYEHAPLLPKKDLAYKDYDRFLKTFGEEGNIIVIGVEDSNFFTLSNFTRWSKLCNDLATFDGVDKMLSIPNSYQLVKNSEKKKFNLSRIFPDSVSSQLELDSLKSVFMKNPFYRGYLFNDTAQSYLLVLTMNKDKMKTKEREQLVTNIRNRSLIFEKESKLAVHYSGLPYIRVLNTILVKKEIFLFSGIAMLVCISVLFFFFRSFKAMVFPALIVLIGVVSAVGTTSLLGYNITILTGMIPPLLIVIGIPNSIFMLNKYHHEYKLHGNKIKALKRVIMKIGNATFLTNLTTACGFATFATTSSDILRQFGIVASLNIMLLFLLSLFLIPIIFSFLPPPNVRHMKHLERKGVSQIINKLIYITLNHRKKVYVAAFFVIVLSAIGITKMHTTGFMVDDLPKNDPIYTDLHFFESNFDGIMPLEIIIDTRKPNGVLQMSTLQNMEKLDNRLKNYSELSPSLSVLNIVKIAKQAFYNGNEKYYSLPSSTEKNFILAYTGNAEGRISMMRSFMDSTKQIARMSIRMKDVGTTRMQALYESFNNDVTEIFSPEKYDVVVTGSSVIFFKGNKYLLRNLFTSLALAVLLISLFMSGMFNSWRMVIMSLTPNLIPLLFTAALMGYTSIPIKASTLLVFSIAFGISVDNTIHFLAKYRQELAVSNWNIRTSVILALRETGVSMIYSSTVLFFGFGIFSLSKFGGTQAMGILVSLTLLVALISNLVLLPSLLIGLERIITTKAFREPLLQIYDEEEDIDLDELEISTLKQKQLNKEINND